MGHKLIRSFKDFLYLPSWGRGVFCIWRRNFLYFRYTLLTTVTWIFIEPLLYLFALGYGLGQFVSPIEGQTYAQFIAPAMMAISGMFVSFFDGTYPTYTKMHRQNTYQTIILTPISPDEIVIGEILWITSKAFLSVISVAIVLALMGLVNPWQLPIALVVLVLMCWVFAAMGVWLATLASSYESFSYSQSGVITPMSLFCGTYFPITKLPFGLKVVAYMLPLTHGLMGVRALLSGDITSTFILNCGYLIVCALLFSNVAAARFNRLLVK